MLKYLQIKNKSKLNILYTSTLCSNRLIDEMLRLKLGIPNLAIQKYHRLLAQGMSKNETLFNLNSLSVPDYNNSFNGNRIIKSNPEVEKGVRYTYIPIVLIPIIKRIFIVLFLLIKILSWKKKSNYVKNIIVFDILNLTTSILAIISSKILRIKSIAIVTDLPEMMFILR